MKVRHPTPRSGKPIRKRNPKRRKSEFARCYGSKARVEWVANEPCIINSICEGIRCENVHIRGDGAGRKADAKFIVPMCSEHHRILHRMGVVTFQKLYTVNLEKLAAKTQERWEDTETT